MIENIYCGEELAAIIIRDSFDKQGIEFVTPDDFSADGIYASSRGTLHNSALS